MDRTVTSYGVSVRGPVHRGEGSPNQDAWLRDSGSYGSLVVVCDGMGSRPESRLGAHAACAAVREATARWTQAKEAPISYLVHLIEVFWRLRIYPCDPKDAATTCLLALARCNGEWVAGGIGDGLVVVQTTDAPLSLIVGNRLDCFSNETHALGTSPWSKAWRLSILPPTILKRRAVLATDGVADDLVADKLSGFCEWIVSEFQRFNPPLRWRRLGAELRDWPTPKHLDDKTIAILEVSAVTAEDRTCL